VKVTLKENTLIAENTDGVKFYSESTLLHHIKEALIKQGYDVIKKLMWKDGHLVSDTQHYIRTRKFKPSDADAFCVYDGDYALRFSYEDYNKGILTLTVER
jgi:hypothetical protein